MYYPVKRANIHGENKASTQGSNTDLNVEEANLAFGYHTVVNNSYYPLRMYTRTIYDTSSEDRLVMDDGGEKTIK